MRQSAHRFIAQYFMDHSDLMLDESFISAENGYFKCNFTVGYDNDAVKIAMQYITAESEENSWIAAGGIIGPMGQITNLPRILDYLNENMVPSYALSMEKRGRILILNRSFRIRNLELNSMFDLTYGIAKATRNIRSLMLPRNEQKSFITADPND